MAPNVKLVKQEWDKKKNNNDYGHLTFCKQSIKERAVFFQYFHFKQTQIGTKFTALDRYTKRLPPFL